MNLPFYSASNETVGKVCLLRRRRRRRKKKRGRRRREEEADECGRCCVWCVHETVRGETEEWVS